MAEGHGWSGASRAGSNHPALASASAAPPYPRRGALSRTHVAVYRNHIFFCRKGSFSPHAKGNREIFCDPFKEWYNLLGRKEIGNESRQADRIEFARCGVAQ
jgi:hypothetical protein